MRNVKKTAKKKKHGGAMDELRGWVVTAVFFQMCVAEGNPTRCPNVAITLNRLALYVSGVGTNIILFLLRRARFQSRLRNIVWEQAFRWASA